MFCRGVPLAAAVLLCACAKPYVQSAPGTPGAPRLTRSYAVMEDGYRLPLSRWESAGNPQAVLLALHGLNDYRRAFDNLGRYLAGRDISVVAYDQRGFGATSGHGLWHGSQRLSADLVTMTALLRHEYPGIPLYLLGESMGGAVALAGPIRDWFPNQAIAEHPAFANARGMLKYLRYVCETPSDG